MKNIRAINDDPINLIYEMTMKDGKLTGSFVRKIPWYAFSNISFNPKKQSDPRDMGITESPDKIHPLLKERIMFKNSDKQKQEVVINFRDYLTIPRFPYLNACEPENSRSNKYALKEAKNLIDEIRKHRKDSYEELIKRKLTHHTLEVLENFWLINGIVAKVPLASVSTLAKNEEVLFIEPKSSSEVPPSDGYPQNDIIRGRVQMDTDRYSDNLNCSEWIALLDTGIRSSHKLFNNPSNILASFDCIKGPDCKMDYVQTKDSDDHGTASAAIISGNSNLGHRFRGITKCKLLVYKVYENGGLNFDAVRRAFEHSFTKLVSVIGLNVQASENEFGTIASLSDKAFDAGRIVISAAGNAGGGAAAGPNLRTIMSPAVAHKVIGVGAYHVETFAQNKFQSCGPTSDNRVKPDIQAPTNTETASSKSDSALQVFINTSGATPYAVGAATLMRCWLQSCFPKDLIEPGLVYAFLILCGQNKLISDISGAGRIKFPGDGNTWYTKTSIAPGKTVNIPFQVSQPVPKRIEGSIWWPEDATDSHSDLDLYLLDPTDSIIKDSKQAGSVFEKFVFDGPIRTGVWTFRIHCAHMNRGSQVVYAAMSLPST